MSQPALYIATPTHDHKLHSAYAAGALQAMVAFRDRIAIEQICGSFLPRNRDILTAWFLNSKATHMLCIDSDIGWTPADAQKLLDTGKDFVSGIYCKKTADRDIPAKLTDETDGGLLGAEYVPGGFLLLSRRAVERMVGAYRDLAYNTPHGRVWALWASFVDPKGDYGGEDVSFCRRWTALGEKIWIHPGVVVRHYGEHCYIPPQEMRFT